MNNTNTLELISNFISLLNSPDFEATIPMLANGCNIPIEYARKFILQLLNNTILKSCITGDSRNHTHYDETLLDKYYDDKDQFSSDLLSGKYDTISWNIDLKVLSPDEEQLLGLDSIEYGALQDLGESHLSIKHGALYERKDNITKVPRTVRQNQELIQTAIINKMMISFSYRDRLGKCGTHTGFPISISTNVVDNWIYFELANEFTYRLDRIIGAVKITKDSISFPEVKINEKKKYVWGSYFNENDEPEHVKVVVTDITPNIIHKIQNDIRHRKTMCKFYKKGNYYYFEDDIIGIPEFQRWLRGYGSSIQVLKPDYLRNDIINASVTALHNYALSEKWNI